MPKPFFFLCVSLSLYACRVSAPQADDRLDETSQKSIPAGQTAPFLKECAHLINNELQLACSKEAVVKHLQALLQYPEEAIKKGLSGEVLVAVLVAENGHITDAKIIQGVHPLVNREAIRAVRQLPLFVPATKAGLVHPSWVEIPVNFELQ